MSESLKLLLKSETFDNIGRLCSPKLNKNFWEDKNEELFSFFSKKELGTKSAAQLIYDELNDINEAPKCLFCENKVDFHKFYSGYKKTCGNDACVRSAYGQNPHIPTNSERERSSIRMRENNPMFDPEIAKKVKATQTKKYGSLCCHMIDSKEKALDSRYDRFGTFSPKSKLFKSKDYKMPNGEMVKIQGYEYMALDLLVKQKLDVVICGKAHKFRFSFGGKIKTYYPDIFLPEKNLYIEVKSDYTYQIAEDKNMAKRQVILNSGFNFQFWIFDKDRNLKII